VARDSGERPRGRFSRSGHTAHTSRGPYAPSDARTAPLPEDRPPSGSGPPPQYGPPPGYGPPPNGAAGERRADPYGQPTYHHTPSASRPPQTQPPGAPGVGRAAATLGRATLVGTNRAARAVTRKVITASKSDGAAESGLTALIWNQVLSYGADAMVTVALAGTVFFGASAHAQRGNVLLYLLITMAPFAVVAPVIGPALDRLQHGRRWTLAATGIGRAILALLMAAHSSELLVLYPCALGSLVFSKAYAVVRAAASPRLVPQGMTLTAANARVTIFGLGSTLVLGGFVGVVIKVTGSYTAGLLVTAIGFVACAVVSLRLPPQVDSATSARRHPQEPPRAKRQDHVPAYARLQRWARRGFPAHIIVALQGESSQRLLSGMLTIYLAFYVESTSHGLAAAVALAGVVGAAGAGNFTGTAIGTRLTGVNSRSVIAGCVCASAAACLLAAILYSILVATIAIFIASVTNALGKIALDSMIQNDVVETLRSGAFARSETFLQLAWVVGAALAVALPSHGTGDGTVAFIVATVIVGAAALVVVLRTRAVRRVDPPTGHPRDTPARPVGGPAAQAVD
jgi:MFS family permease